MSSETTSEGGVAVTQAEFVAREFQTTVTDSDREWIVEAVETAISNLRNQIDDDHLPTPPVRPVHYMRATEFYQMYTWEKLFYSRPLI